MIGYVASSCGRDRVLTVILNMAEVAQGFGQLINVYRNDGQESHRLISYSLVRTGKTSISRFFAIFYAIGAFLGHNGSAHSHCGAHHGAFLGYCSGPVIILIVS